MRHPALFLAAVLTLGCGQSKPATTGGSDKPDALLLTATMSHDELGPGDTATATFRLVNQRRDTVRLAFNSGCQIVPNIADSAGNPVVLGTICSMALTELVLAPGTESSTTLLIGGRDAATVEQHARLAPGEYKVFATVSHKGGTLRSDDVRLTVR